MSGLIEVGDMDNDGSIDLVVGRSENNSHSEDVLSIFLNSGDGYQFHSAFAGSFQIIRHRLIAMLVHGFGSNGKNELSLCFDNNYVRTFSGEYHLGALQYGVGWAFQMYAYPSVMIRGRFNDDNQDDLALISPESDTLSVVVSLGLSVRRRQLYLTESRPTAISVINFNNDTIDDLAVLTCDGTLTVFLGQSIGLFDQDYLSFKMNNSIHGHCAHSLKSADLNQDGKDDMVFIDPEADRIRVILGSSCDEEF